MRLAFGDAAFGRIEAAIKASEKRHRGEVRFVVEGALDFVSVVRGLTPRERAVHVFSVLRVWDTEENTGVLLYLQLVDRDIEIVADRGIARLSVGTSAGGSIGWRSLADSDVGSLPGFERPRAFTF